MAKLSKDTYNDIMAEVDSQDASPLQSQPEDAAFLVRLSLNYAFLYVDLAEYYGDSAPPAPCRQYALALAAQMIRLLAVIDEKEDTTK